MEPQLLTVIDKVSLKNWAPSEWFNWQFEKKYDGARCTIVGGLPLSRTGKKLFHLNTVLQELGKKAKEVVLDGEIVGTHWSDTMHRVRAQKGRSEDELIFRPFDMLTVYEWQSQRSTRELKDRQQLLADCFADTAHVQKVQSVQLRSYAEFKDFYAEAMADGCDGVVLKQLHSMYEFKRTKTWLKVKPEMTVDGIVTGQRPGKLKYEGTLGALVFRPEGGTVRDELGQTPTTQVSGMSDKQRHAWWTTPELIVGKTIEVKCRGVHPTGKLIEPRFVRIREDK